MSYPVGKSEEQIVYRLKLYNDGEISFKDFLNESYFSRSLHSNYRGAIESLFHAKSHSDLMNGEFYLEKEIKKIILRSQRVKMNSLLSLLHETVEEVEKKLDNKSK